jgi:hypothetical protein
MAKYKLCVLGWGMEGCAHTLTNEEVQKLRDYKDKNSHNEYSEMYSELPEILESFEHGDTNWWTASRPYVNSSLRFVLKNENDEVVWETPHTETLDVYELDEKYGLPKDFENLMESIDAYPHDGHENILCVIEDVKGTLSNYIIESDEVPVVEDFGFTTHSLESPVFDYEYMDKMFYKNQELEKDFEDEWINGKSLDIYVFTLEDVNDGVYDLDEEE